MTVEERIKAIAGTMGITYVFDNWSTANVKLDNVEFPVLLNVLPASGRFVVGKARLADAPNCMFAFLDKTEFDFDGTNNDAIIERCKDISKKFIKAINESGQFEQIEGDVPYSVVYDKLDVNVTGIVIEMQVKELAGTQICKL